MTNLPLSELSHIDLIDGSFLYPENGRWIQSYEPGINGGSDLGAVADDLDATSLCVRLNCAQPCESLITLENLDSGKIIHTGWTFNGRDTKLIDTPKPEEACDVSPWMYFDLASGKFLGPDENGLVPTFSEAE